MQNYELFIGFLDMHRYFKILQLAEEVSTTTQPGSSLEAEVAS